MNSGSRLTLYVVLGVLIGMLVLAFNAPALYRTFCQVTGFGGTTQIAEKAPGQVLDRTVNVRLDANVGRGAELTFKPIDRLFEIKLGEMGMAFFEVTNPSDQPVTAIAGYNVAPHKAGPYFAKLECFCFEERVFAPGETERLPVIFYIDPDLDGERVLDDITEITLSYTFYGHDDAGLNQTASLEDSVSRQ